MSVQKIIVADDHPLMRMGLRSALENRMETAVLHDCADFNELTAELKKEPADCILFDLDMPGMRDGFCGLEEVRTRWPAVPVIVFTASEDPATRQRSRQCGASGFIPKSSRPERIACVIQTVLAGSDSFDNGAGTHQPTPDGVAALPCRLKSLTPQEQAVGRLLAKGKSNKYIAEKLGVKVSTIKGHVTAIFRKLGVRNRVEAAIALAPLLTM